MKRIKNGFFIIECMVYMVIFGLLLVHVFSMTQHICANNKRLFQKSSILQELFVVHMAFLNEIHSAPSQEAWTKQLKHECQWVVNHQVTSLTIDNNSLIKSFFSQDGASKQYTAELCHVIKEGFFEYTEDRDRIILVSLHLVTKDNQKLTFCAAPGVWS